MAESEGLLRVLSPAQKFQSLPLQLPLTGNIGTAENCFSPEFFHSVLDSFYTKSEKLVNLNLSKIALQTTPFFPMAGENLPVLTEEATNRKNPKLPARYLEVGRAILQDFQFSVWIAVKKKNTKKISLFFPPSSVTAQKKN